jgi:hypothetical protein
VLLKLQTSIENIIAPQLQSGCPAKNQHRPHRQPCYHLSKIGHYFHELSRLGLWPLSGVLYRNNFQTISRKLLEFENYIPDEVINQQTLDPQTLYQYPVTYTYPGQYDNCCFDASASQIDLRQSLIQAAEDATAAQKGLCLQCVKNGKVSVYEGNCQAQDEGQHQHTLEGTA